MGSLSDSHCWAAPFGWGWRLTHRRRSRLVFCIRSSFMMSVALKQHTATTSAGAWQKTLAERFSARENRHECW